MKKILKIHLLLTLILLSTSCSMLIKNDDDIADIITLNTAKELKNEKGMDLAGTIGGTNSIGMLLNHYHSLEEEDARKLALFTVDKLVYNLQNNEKARSFKIEEIKIFLTFYYPDGRDIEPGKIDHIVINNGMLKYKSITPETGLPQTILLTESITEARQKAKS